MAQKRLNAFRVVLADNEHTLTTIRYDEWQVAKRERDGHGGWNYNRAGAHAAARTMQDAWQRSEQFPDRAIAIREIAL